ncbi:MAG TPA: hypothetical protein VHG33_00840 [Woeseiaceae bacterium]|nr:hypothetical protein [Woeseiaceae bacterium]
MSRPPPSACRPNGLGLTVALIVSLLLLVGCSGAGDFGRPRYAATVTLAGEGDPLLTGSVTPSVLPLTDDERQLRALSAGILGEPHRSWTPVNGFRSDPGSLLVNSGPKPESYAHYLVHGPFRSSAARYSKLIDDTRSDIVRADQFFALARRVADLDAKREGSLALAAPSTAELVNARRRMRENMMLMAEVHRTLLTQAALYRFALERLVIAVPSPMAVDAERTRSELERRLAAIRVIGGESAALASTAEPS